MALSRRAFVRYGTTAAALAAVPADALRAIPRFTRDSGALDALANRFDPADVHALATRAVNAAREAGATYADVRMIRSVEQVFEYKENYVVGANVNDEESLAVGVRALVGGYWGFVASPYWHPDEMVKLAKDAVAQAKTNAIGGSRVVEWEPIPIAKGTWVTPGVDPFSIPIEEKLDFVNGWRVAVSEYPAPSGYVASPQGWRLIFNRQERFFASTEGAATTQVLYSFVPIMPSALGVTDWRAAQNQRPVDIAPKEPYPQRAGWDAILAADFVNQLPQMFENGVELLKMKHKPVDIGRYNVVLDGKTTAGLISTTFGKATQLDLALGYEANAGGTSYLGPDPLELLGTFKAASPIVTITANRSLPGGLSTVKWDDEGVEPEEFALVKDGILADYQTTREQAAWLRPWYAKQNRPVRSHGCANASSAMAVTSQHIPNLAITPSATSETFESLVAGTSKGLAVINGYASTDFQAKNGRGGGMIREIVDGKLGAVCDGASFLFGTSELWNNVTAIGGAQSTVQSIAMHYKGEPAQRYYSTNVGVPMAVKNMSIIDYRRRS